MKHSAYHGFFFAVGACLAIAVSGCMPEAAPEQMEDEPAATEGAAPRQQKPPQSEKERLEDELAQMLDESYGGRNAVLKAYELFEKQVAGHAGMTLKDFGIATRDDFPAFFQTAPTETIKDIRERVEKRAQNEIYLEENLTAPEALMEKLKAENPILPLHTKIKTHTTYGREVIGEILDRNSNYIKIGSKRYPRTDFTMESRFQLFEADRDAMLPQLMKDELFNIRRIIKKQMPLKMKASLPPALLQANYIPNVLLPAASFTSADAGAWTSRQALLENLTAQVRQQQEAFTKDFWTSHGYALRSTADGMVWMKKTK